ncbi:MAG TPA: hypothetical protein VF175_14200 [Lacipirellula sp.]
MPSSEMKFDPHLPQLPSISELLEHPRVKGVVARINRSTIAQRATGFLEELRWSLAERTGKVEVPSVAQLAERLARRLLGEPPAGGPVINATGVVVGDAELRPPLADAALHAMVQVAGEYHDQGRRLQQSAEAELCHLTGAEAASAVNSFEAALHIVLGSLAANREVLLLGAETGVPAHWRKLAARHGVILHTSDGDLSRLSSEFGGRELAAVVRAATAETTAPTHEVAAAVGRRNLPLIDVHPVAGLLNPADYGMQPVETLRQRIEGGADIVVAEAAGLLGGPSCGLIIGRRSLVETAARHFLASISSISAATAAALHATLSIYRDAENVEAAFTIPVWQLLSAPLANLQQRAERLSSLLAATGHVAAAEPVETERPWLAAGDLRLSSPTWGIDIRPKGSDSAMLGHLLRCERPIVAKSDNGVVHLDLRSVFPRWDQQLVAAVEGLTT